MPSKSRRTSRAEAQEALLFAGIDPFTRAPDPALADIDDDDSLLPEPLTPRLPSLISTPAARADDAGARLDKWLADLAPELSRSRVKALIEAGHVTVDGVTIEDPSARVKPGQSATIEVPEAAAAHPEPQPIPLNVVYEDDHLIVVDKPAGLVVHPAPGSPDGTLVNGLLHHCGAQLSGIGGVRRPGIVHRIDKETSGLMVVAKSDVAHQGLSTQFADKSVERAYRAVVWGMPRPASGEVEGNIGRSPANRQKMAVVKRGGKWALTRYKLLRTFLGGAASLVECRLATGRTHQIRVHMSHVGHTLIGDPVYGSNRNRRRGIPEPLRVPLAAFPRQALHAYLLGFTHPVTGQALRFESPLPDDMRRLIDLLEEATAAHAP